MGAPRFKHLEVEAVPLEKHVENLLRKGKRSSHRDFQDLFAFWGEPKIRAIAERKLEEIKAAEAADALLPDEACRVIDFKAVATRKEQG